MPKIHNLLLAGEDGSIIIEVLSHLNLETVRGISLTRTQVFRAIPGDNNRRSPQFPG
jgi:F-type H+-transporting ATPase subunit beta